MTDTLSTYTVAWEKLPNFLPLVSLPAWKRFVTNVHLETNEEVMSTNLLLLN